MSNEVVINPVTNEVVINPVTNVVEISAPGPQGSAGSAFSPIADNATGSAVSGTLSILGGTNVTTSVSGTEITINSSGESGTVTGVTLQGDSGSGATINTSGNIKVAATAPISTTVSGDTVTVTHDTPPGTGTATNFPASIVVDSTGHVSSVGASTTPILPANNLNDVLSAGTARTNLGLGSSSTLDVPSSGNAASGEVVKGNDSRLTDARTPTTTLDHNADKITTGELVAARGGTGLTSISTLLNSNTTKSDVGLGNVENTAISTFAGSSNITTVGTISSGTWGGTAIAYADVSGTPTLGTAAAAATGDFSPVAGSGSITTVGTISSGTWSGTAIGYGSLSGKPSLGTASQYNAGIGSNSILQADANVADDDFLRVAGTKVEGRTAAEVLTDIGAQASLTAPVTSPAMTGVSAGSITGVIKCSQSQYDAITPDANTLYVIV